MSSSEFTRPLDLDLNAQPTYPSPFDRYVIAMCESASRHICIQSPKLDYAAFDNTDLVHALSALARSSRQARVKILINDARPLVTRGHRLLELARRLPSIVHIRKLVEHPQWNNETVVLRDRDAVLFKPGGSDHDAFYQAESRASVKRHLTSFDDLWRYSVEDSELRAFHL